MDRFRYYRSILLVMLATNSIYLLVNNFSFLTYSIDHRSENKNFSSIKSNHQLKIFFLLKIIDLIDVFYSLSIIGIDLIDVFFAIGAHLWVVLPSGSHLPALTGGRINPG